MKKIILTSAVTLLLAILSYHFCDREIAIFFKYSPLLLKDTFELITHIGDSKYSLLISFFIFIYFRLRSKRLYESQAIFVWLSIAISGIVADIIKPIIGRARPRLFFEQNIYGFDFFKIGHIYNSFPSGHSATAMSLGFSLALLFPKYKLYFLTIAVVTAFSRVVITAHYLSDVLVGGLIGVLTALILEKYFRNHKCYNIYQNGCKL